MKTERHVFEQTMWNEEFCRDCGQQADAEIHQMRDVPIGQPAEDARVKPDIADWLKPQCQRLRYRRCTTLYCLRRGGYIGKGGPTDYSIATCEPYEIYNALYSSAVQPAASTPTNLKTDMETIDSLLVKVTEARPVTYGEIENCRQAIRRIVAAASATTERWIKCADCGRERAASTLADAKKSFVCRYCLGTNPAAASREAQDERKSNGSD